MPRIVVTAILITAPSPTANQSRSPLFQQPAIDLLVIRGIERYDPARVIDGPVAGATPRGDRCPDRVLQATGFKREINAHQSDGAGEIGGERAGNH